MADTAFKGIVYKGRENTIIMTIKESSDGGATYTDKVWTSVTRMTLHVVSFDAVTGLATAIVALADTAVDATLIDYSVNGQVTLKLGGLLTNDATPAEIPNGEYLIRLTAWDGTTDTEIVHESAQMARLLFVETDSVT